MAGYIKGITIEFGANTTKLNKALNNVNGKLNKTQAELKQVNRSLKFNPGNTTLLNQKFKLLQQTVKQTEKKLQGLKAMQARMKSKGIDENSAQYRQLQREIIKTEDQLKQAENELKRFGSVGKQQVLAVGNSFKTVGGKISAAGRSITTSVSVYGMAAIYTGKKLIDSYQKQMEAEQKLSEIYKSRMDVGKKAVKSTLDLASAQQKVGVVGDEVQLAGAQQLATYAKYPSTVNKLLPSLNDLLVQQKGLNGTQEDAVGLANLFGKAMMGQTGALKKAGISFTEAQEEVLKYGTEEEKAAMLAEVVQQNVGDMNEEFAKTDAGKIQQAKNELGDMGEEIGGILLPAVADLVSWLQDNLLPKIQQFIDFMKEHPQIAKFALAFALITAALGPVLMLLGGVVSFIGGIITIAPVLGAAFTALGGPIGIVVGIIAALVAIGIAVYKNWDTIKAKAEEVWGRIQNAVAVVVGRVKTNFNTLKTNVTNVWNGIKNTASKVWNGIKDAITKPIDTAKNTVQKIIKKIKGFFPLSIGKFMKNIKLPHFSLSWGSKDFGKLGSIKYPKGFKVNWYKKAMEEPYMFNNATLFGAGEAGSEILYGRSNLMRDIANAVASSSMSGVVVNVYGSDNMSVNELAEAVERRLITMQNRRTQAWA